MTTKAAVIKAPDEVYSAMTDQAKLLDIMKVFNIEITKETLRSFSVEGRKFYFNLKGELIKILDSDGKIYKSSEENKLEVE